MNTIFKVSNCPFCGGAARFGTMAMRKRGLAVQRAFIGCKRCRILRDFESLTVAISWWNKRCEPHGQRA